MLMFAFYDYILLWSFNTANLMQNAFGIIEIYHGKLSTITKSHNFDFGAELSFNHVEESLKYLSGLWFVSHQKSPSRFNIVVNYSQEVLWTVRDEAW